MHRKVECLGEGCISSQHCRRGQLGLLPYGSSCPCYRVLVLSEASQLSQVGEIQRLGLFIPKNWLPENIDLRVKRVEGSSGRAQLVLKSYRRSPKLLENCLSFSALLPTALRKTRHLLTLNCKKWLKEDYDTRRMQYFLNEAPKIAPSTRTRRKGFTR